MGNAMYKEAGCPAEINNHVIHSTISVMFNVIPFIGPAIDGAVNSPPPNMQPQLDMATANLNTLTMNWQKDITDAVYKNDVDVNNLLKTILGDGTDGSDYAYITSQFANMANTEQTKLLTINLTFLGIVVAMIFWYLMRNKTS